MRYPEYIVDMFRDYLAADSAEDYDPNECEHMLDMIQQECETYASESGADLELDYEQDTWFEDLDEQTRGRW